MNLRSNARIFEMLCSSRPGGNWALRGSIFAFSLFYRVPHSLSEESYHSHYTFTYHSSRAGEGVQLIAFAFFLPPSSLRILFFPLLLPHHIIPVSTTISSCQSSSSPSSHSLPHTLSLLSSSTLSAAHTTATILLTHRTARPCDSIYHALYSRELRSALPSHFDRQHYRPVTRWHAQAEPSSIPQSQTRWINTSSDR